LEGDQLDPAIKHVCQMCIHWLIANDVAVSPTHGVLIWFDNMLLSNVSRCGADQLLDYRNIIKGNHDLQVQV
jgi:hypothetical protein